MKPILWIAAVPVAALGAYFCFQTSASAARESDGKAAPAACCAAQDEEVAIAVNTVPAAVLAAANGAVAGIVFTSAERETEKGLTVYCLVGSANGKRYEVEVTADGKVVEIEDADDDEDDDDDDDADDDHDD